MRIEDTDRERYVPNAVINILKSLHWAGFEPDEGVKLECITDSGDCVVTQEGKDGPYIQSERLEIYKKYAQELVDAGHAYYCFCAPERLSELREKQQAKKLPTGYDGHCASIDPKEAEKRAKAGEKCVIRMKMPKTGETIFRDNIRGEVSFKNELIDDQVIMKSDGYPTYHFAVVVDDHLMGITHIIRGEEWISSVPKHIQLYKYFGWDVPEMAHLPLLLNPDKSKLSKRQGDVAAEDYQKKGYLPEAMINFVALLGWNPGTEKEMFTLAELIEEFDLSRVGKAGAVFNIEKLDWFNKQYIKKLSDEELAERSRPWFDESGITTMENFTEELLKKAIVLERERVTVLSELPDAVKFVFRTPDYPADLLVWKKSSKNEVKNVLPGLAELMNTISVHDWNREKLEEKIVEWIKEKEYSTGSVLWPLRVALSGQEKSPGPFEIAEVLGKDETLARISSAADRV